MYYTLAGRLCCLNPNCGRSCELPGISMCVFILYLCVFKHWRFIFLVYVIHCMQIRKNYSVRFRNNGILLGKQIEYIVYSCML